MANTITIGDFNSQKENFTVIDVREPDEMAGGKIDGSKNVPLGLVIRNAKKGHGRIKRKKNCSVTSMTVKFSFWELKSPIVIVFAMNYVE